MFPVHLDLEKCDGFIYLFTILNRATLSIFKKRFLVEKYKYFFSYCFFAKLQEFEFYTQTIFWPFNML